MNTFEKRAKDADALSETISRLDISRILLSCIHLAGYGGSQNVTLDLAKIFKRRGVEVDVITNSLGSPMEDEFRKIGITPISLQNAYWEHKLHAHYDLLFGFHWPVYGAVLYCSDVRFRYVVLASLSHFEPAEALSLGEEFADLLLFGTTLNWETYSFSNLSSKAFDFLPNSVPEEWFSDHHILPNPSRIAIVSNHPPQELLLAKEMIEDAGYTVDVIGASHKSTLVDIDSIDSFSAVVTIGLTVQKSLARGRPVFLYDRFGGIGWLQTERVALLEQENFSCRGVGKRWAPEKITSVFLAGFREARALSTEYRKLAEERYRLEVHIARILGQLPEKARIVGARRHGRQKPAIMIELLRSRNTQFLGHDHIYVDARYNFSRSLAVEYSNSPELSYKDIVVESRLDVYPGSSLLKIYGNLVLKNDRNAELVFARRNDGERFIGSSNGASPWLAEKYGVSGGFERAFFSLDVPIEHDTRYLEIYVVFGQFEHQVFRIDFS